VELKKQVQIDDVKVGLDKRNEIEMVKQRRLS